MEREDPRDGGVLGCRHLSEYLVPAVPEGGRMKGLTVPEGGRIKGRTFESHPSCLFLSSQPWCEQDSKETDVVI